MSDVRKRVSALLKKVRIGRRGSTAKRAARQLLQGFERFGIDFVFDVGANTGQFAQQIRGAGFSGPIVSFEPLSDAHKKLREAATSDARWSVHDRCALGDSDGSTVIYIAGNSVSSSIMTMSQAHEDAAPGSAYVGQETVPVWRLDSVAASYLGVARRPFLKIDTQGFEWHVLTGARETLPRLEGVLCELSLVVLYEGQHLWRETIDRLEAAGFTLWGLQPGFTDKYGRNLQVDAIFFRVR
ncbi:MAG: FkbM family methyltransferase [Gammaproteobacteria bacterium]